MVNIKVLIIFKISFKLGITFPLATISIYFLLLPFIKFGKKYDKEIIYLGYWINGCKEMEYKKNFNSSEILINDEWINYEKENY